MGLRNARNNEGWGLALNGLGGALACGGALMITPAALAQASGGVGSLDEPTVRMQHQTGAHTNTTTHSDPNTPEMDEGEGVEVSEYMTVDIFVQDEDLATVLQMLSLQSQRNIVASRDVVATVTANLYGVTFYEALDAILHVNGYGYVEQGNFIYVYPAEVIQQMQAEQRRVISKVIQLNYLNANDAAEFVAPLLSPDVGQIKTNGDVGAFTLTDNTPSGNEEFALSATLVVYDYPENVEEIEELLRQLDTRPAQVLVEASILQMRLTEDNAFGIDFSIIGDIDFQDFGTLGGPLGIVDSLLQNNDETAFTPADNNASGLQSTPGNTSGPATLKVGVVQDDFSIFARFLDEVSDTTVLSNPKILTLNRQPARVLVGRKIGYLSTTTTETSTSQTVEFLDTGTQLAFRPFISTDGMIRMELAPSVSEGFIRNSTDATGSTVTIPDEVTQEISTNVMVRDGSTVVLGGLFREQTDLSRSQVPILGDIPLLGTAFRGHDDTTDRTEIIFMIKPTIVNDQMLAEDADAGYEYMERVRTGSRQGVLPWSRDRQTAQLNVEAERLAREGNLDRAMWNLRRSLELNPVQPDALELRERLLNQSDEWPSRSILEHMIDGAEHPHFEEWEISENETETSAPVAEWNDATPSNTNPGFSGGWFGKPFFGTTTADAEEAAMEPENDFVETADADEHLPTTEQSTQEAWAPPQQQGTEPEFMTVDEPSFVDPFENALWPWLAMNPQDWTLASSFRSPGAAPQQSTQNTASTQGVDWIETTANVQDSDDE